MDVLACTLFTVFISTDVTTNDTAAEGSVRLVGGDTLLEGRVEIFLFGQWGTVCDDRWDLVDATVVCHELGYQRAVEAPRSAYFGAGSGPSWYYSVRCIGTERNLTECSYSNYNFGSACPHSQDAGVVCSSECNCTIVQMHLFSANFQASHTIYSLYSSHYSNTVLPEILVGRYFGGLLKL